MNYNKILLSVIFCLNLVTLSYSQFNVSDHIKEGVELNIRDFVIPSQQVKGATYFQATKQGTKSGFTSTRSYIRFDNNQLAVIKKNRIFDGKLISSDNSIIEFSKYEALIKGGRKASVIEDGKNYNKPSVLLKMPQKPDEYVTWTEVEPDGTVVENKAHFFVYRHYTTATKSDYILGIQVLSESSNAKLNFNVSMVYEYVKGLGFVRSLIKDKTLDRFIPFDVLDELINDGNTTQSGSSNKAPSTKYLTSRQYDSLVTMKKSLHQLQVVNPIAYEKAVSLLRSSIKLRLKGLSDEGSMVMDDEYLTIPHYNYFLHHKDPFILDQTYSYSGYYRFEEDRMQNFSANGIVSANGNYSFNFSAANKIKSPTRYFQQLLPKHPIFPASDSSGVDMSTCFGVSDVKVYYIKGITTIKVKKGVITFQKNHPPVDYQELILKNLSRETEEGSFVIGYEGGTIMGEPYIITKKLDGL